MKILGHILGFTDRVNVWSGKILSYGLFALIGVVVTGVIARYAFNSPLMWTYEMSLFLFGGLGFLVGAAVLQTGAHIKVDILYSRLSPRGKATADTITGLVFLYFIIVLLWQGTEFALHSIAIREHSGSIWGPVVYPFKTVIPVAAFLMLITGLAKFIRDLLFAIRGKALS